ncbi:MAG: class I tRNA ligase family protein, partial [Candidatus Saccharibacteria bacterium]
NYEDPMQITAKYGTDALRMALSIGISAGNNGSLHNEKVQGYRNFCNKLWNVARFIIAKVPEDTKPSDVVLHSPADHWIVARLNETIIKTTKDIEELRFSEAGQAIYSLLWDDIADKYVEYSKQSPNNALLAYSLDTVLRLAHPYAPFVTEAIWQKLMWTSSNLITEQWPNVIHKSSTEKAQQFELEIIKILSAKQKDANQVEILKLSKELAAKNNMLKISITKLSNKNFVANAPENIVQEEQGRQDQAKLDIVNLKAQIEKLKSKQ